MRVFFDANVLVSAFVARGLCADLLGLVDADLFVTGDQGVLACSKPPLPLVNPRRCWEQLRGAG